VLQVGRTVCLFTRSQRHWVHVGHNTAAVHFVCADDVNLDPDSFRAAFAQTGGVAVVKPTNNYTITSGEGLLSLLLMHLHQQILQKPSA
jgi:hypothetical protein